MSSTPTARRKSAACQRCHHKKTRCFGGTPCQSCRSAGLSCTHPLRDRNVTVSEAYLNSLHARLAMPPPSEHPGGVGDHSSRSVLLETGHFQPGQSLARVSRLDNSTTETFVSGLQKLGAIETSLSSLRQEEPQLNQTLAKPAHNRASQYDYFRLTYDSNSLRITINLPPYPYAVQLVNQFETFVGYEYHWYLREAFRQRFEITYRNPASPQARDRVWLCLLLSVLALGESYNSCLAPSIQISDGQGHDDGSSKSNASDGVPPPGTVFLEQALSLFEIPSEEPTIDHVQALNLITFYCYSLNRRRTAYMYAGLGLRIACSLMIHKQCHEGSALLKEHQRRVWWTTWQIDAMTASELGLNSAFRLRDVEVGLPSADALNPTEQSEFADFRILRAHLRLYSIKASILDITSHLHVEDVTDFQEAFRAPMEQLERWKTELPGDYSFEFSEGIPQQMLVLVAMRSLASIYLRYHQLYIFLIRPVFFKLLAVALSNDTNETFLDVWISLSNKCFEAAQSNMRILTGLWKCDRIAKYGFWESVHLFSSLKIFSLASIFVTIRPHCALQDQRDLDLYTEARDILTHMATVGNLAAKSHLHMLEDIEKLLDVVTQSQLQRQVELDPEIFDWINTLDGPDYFLDNSMA